MPRRNRRASASLSPVLIHFVSPTSFLARKLQECLQHSASTLPLPLLSHRHPGPSKPHYGIPAEEWPTVLRRIEENQEPLRTVADDYGVSYETVRRVVQAMSQQRASS